jgi:HlyD family secretion protein
MLNISSHISESSETLTHLVNESKRGLRDIHSLNLGDKLFKIFGDANGHLRHSQAKAVTLSSLPKNVIEPFAIIFLLLSTYLYNDSEKPAFIIIEVGSIAYAIQKLLPYLQQIYSSITNIRGSYYSVEDVAKLASVKISAVNMLNQSKYLSFDSLFLQKVCFFYGEQLILDNIILTIDSGDSILIKGNTGSGKSTLIDMIAGLIHPSSGYVVYNSINITESKLSIANIVSFISQRVFIIKGTVYENITLGLSDEELSNITKDRLNRALHISDLDLFVKNVADGLNHLIDEDGINISGGQRQRIGIARSVLLNRDILIFDEATNALDKVTELNVVQRLFNWKAHRTFIFISHENILENFCNRKIQIHNNKLIIDKLP